MSVTARVHPCYMLRPSSALHMPQLWKLCLAPMLFTLSIWKRCSERYSLSSSCPPLLNILFNPDIPDSLSYKRMLPWTQAGMFRLCPFVKPATQHLLTFPDLQRMHQIPPKLLHSYLQIRHFFFSIRSPSLTLEKPTDFEALCAKGSYESQMISTICEILHEAVPVIVNNNHYVRKWSQNLQYDILLDWGSI